MTGLNMRDYRRVPCEFEATIERYEGSQSLRAVVRNISARGARLEGVEVLTAPEHFELAIVNESGQVERRRARRVWQDQNALGVAFLDAFAR
jgi:hypothetical protein